MQNPPQVLSIPTNQPPTQPVSMVTQTLPSQPMSQPISQPMSQPISMPTQGSFFNQPPVTNPFGVPKNNPQTHTPLPVIPSSFPELDSKSAAEIANMLNDEVEFSRFLDSLSAVQTMKKVRDDLRNTNEDLAKKNLAREAEIEKTKRDLMSQTAQVNEKRASFEQRVVRQQEVMKQFSTPALIEQLNSAAAEAEATSENIATTFLKGDMDHKDFVKDFMEARKLYHLRAAKKESLQMLTR